MKSTLKAGGRKKNVEADGFKIEDAWVVFYVVSGGEQQPVAAYERGSISGGIEREGSVTLE